MRLIRWVAPFLVLFAQPALAGSSPELTSLEQQLASLVAGRSGDYGIAAVDLRNGKTVSINGDTAFPMASTVKVAIAATYLTQVDHGHRSLSDRIAGRSATSLIEAMLIHSDNHATDLLIANLGGPATIQSWLDYHKLDGIRMDRTIAELLRARRDLRDIRDSATPEAMVALLQLVNSGPALSASSRSYMLSVMRRCATGKNRIVGLLPFGTMVEHKTGTLNGLTDDVGFITLPDGRRLAVAFFARGGTDRPRSIAEAARAVYDGFARLVTIPARLATSTP